MFVKAQQIIYLRSVDFTVRDYITILKIIKV